MASAIDATKPVSVNPTTQSVRDNFAAAKSEIEALQLGTTKVRTYSVTGILPMNMLPGSARWYPEGNIEVTGVFFSLGTPGSTKACNAMLKRNGVNFLSAAATAAAGAYKSNTVVPPAPTADSDDYFTVDVQSLDGYAQNMTVFIHYKNIV